MCQRVLIAAALAGEPQLLIADEPTSALDVTVQAQLIQLLGRLRDELDLSMILITHDFGVVAGLADRVTVLINGQVVEHGRTADILRSPRHTVTKALIAAVPRLGEPTQAPRRRLRQPAHPLVELRHADVRFGGRRGSVVVLDQVELEVAEGEAVGIVGESGCGKTTLARVIVGLQKLDAGSVRLHPDRVRSPGRVGTAAQLVYQDPSAALDPRQTVGASLDEALLLSGETDAGQRRRRSEQLLDQVGLEPTMSTRLPAQLSGGQRQRIVIARALTARPRLLVLDEPVSSLDVSVRAEILDLLAALRDDGVSLVLISHDLAVVERLVDRVLVMAGGHIVEAGPTRQVLTCPRHPVTRELIAAVPRLERTQRGSETNAVTDDHRHDDTRR
jgi:peptide/nickel transport system ATP-binding protein